jgi:hypothetical protein
MPRKITDACSISLTNISAQKRLKVGVNKNISWVIIETCLLDLRCLRPVC